MDELILEKLYKTFPLKERHGTGGMKFKYIPNENVIDRMNKVFKGNWSTIVVDKKIIEDQLLIEVLVSVLDPDTKIQFSHTGFGSQPVARYKDGTNIGKIVDIGNVYKSALAKAIVNACTRWGVGLFKETNVYNIDDIPDNKLPIDTSVVLPTQSENGKVSPQTELKKTSSNIPVIPTQKVVTSSTTLTQDVPPQPINVPAPKVVQESTIVLPKVPIPNNEQTVIASPNTVMPVGIPQQPAINTVPSTPEVPFATQPTESMGISDVQCVALNGILDMHGIEYDVLAKEAFAEKGISRPIPKKEELNYDDAVVIIKYGNDKFRKR